MYACASQQVPSYRYHSTYLPHNLWHVQCLLYCKLKDCSYSLEIFDSTFHMRPLNPGRAERRIVLKLVSVLGLFKRRDVPSRTSHTAFGLGRTLASASQARCTRKTVWVWDTFQSPPQEPFGQQKRLNGGFQSRHIAARAEGVSSCLGCSGGRTHFRECKLPMWYQLDCSLVHVSYAIKVSGLDLLKRGVL